MAEGTEFAAGVKRVLFPEETLQFPSRIPLDLIVEDRDTITELCRHLEGEERDQFALSALRIGVLALRQARGQVDGEQIRREADHLLVSLQSKLTEHASAVQDRLSGALKE